MLFTKYASPFDFLDGMTEMGEFEQALDRLVEQEQEKKLWEMYLHSHSDKSFNEWKEQVLEDNPKPSEAMSKEEVTTEIDRSKEILKSFH